MSNLVDLYNTTDKIRPADSRERIPLQGTDFWDREKKDAKGFSVDQDRSSPTQFTQGAQDQYNTEKDDLTPPESFNPEFPLHRFTPENPFFRPGEGQS